MSLAPVTSDISVVWKPIANSSQEIALDTRCDETLYTGSRGPGKSDVQLMRFRRRVGLGYGPFWRGVIFDREYKMLDDLVSKSKRWFNKFNDGAEFLSSTSSYKWVWPTGEELLFRVIDKIDDYDNYHGQEYPYIGWNELTKFPTSELYDVMFSCNRSSFTPEKDSPVVDGKRILLPNIPLEVFSTCNSFGPGHNWVKEHFITPAPYGQVVRTPRTVFNPRTQKEEVFIRTRVAIFGSYKENIYLDPQYIASLSELKDENRKKSWLDGNWDVVAGGALDGVWEPKTHVIERFKIPSAWRVYIDRSFDWGSSHPFSVGWWVETNGEEVTLPSGRKFAPRAGSLIQIAEWYGTQKIGTNKGIKMSAKDIAVGIRETEKKLMADGWIPYQPWPGPADNEIRSVRDSGEDTIEKKMGDKGIRWTESDKSPGSRRNGLQLVRDRLENSMRNEGEGLYFMEHCRASVITLPVLPNDPKYADDVDTKSEDHVWDMVRYRVLAGGNRTAREVNFRWTN